MAQMPLEGFVKFLESPLFALCACIALGAIALTGKFSVRLGQYLLVSGLVIGILALARSPLRDNLYVLFSSAAILSSIFLGLIIWVRKQRPVSPALMVQDIVLGNLIPGQPFTASVYFKNTTNRVIRIRNLAFTQTRPFPRNRTEEMENENAIWSAVTDHVDGMGRDAEVPTMGKGEFNQVLETATVSLPEYRDILAGNHATYFAMLTRDRDTEENLIELCFFVGKQGIVHYCSSHNRP
jgi:hypothetical protein